MELSAGDTISSETFDFETNLDVFGGESIVLATQIYDVQLLTPSPLKGRFFGITEIVDNFLN